MELSVYISNERIEIVAGTGSKSKAKIKKVYSLAVPEGTIMNGIITGCLLYTSVDIPAVFQCYNQLSEDSHARWRYIQMTTFRKETTNAAKCVGCGACTKKCPQHLDIPQLLKEAKKELETPMFKIINWGTHFFHFY